MVIDAGANIGGFSVYAADALGDTSELQVFAYEPVRDHWKVLLRHHQKKIIKDKPLFLKVS